MLADEVRRGPLRSRAGSGGPARPTAIESWQRRSGEEGGEGGEGRRRASDIKSNNPHLAGGEKSCSDPAKNAVGQLPSKNLSSTALVLLAVR